MKSFFAYLIITFIGYFFGSVAYVNILHFTGLEHNIYVYMIFIMITIGIAYKNRMLIMSKMKYRSINLPSLFIKKKK